MEILAGLRNGVAVRSSVQAPCRVHPELVPAHGGAELSPARVQRERKGLEMPHFRPHINHGGFNLIENHTVSIPPADCQSARKPWGWSLEDSPEYGEAAAAAISSSPPSPPFISRNVETNGLVALLLSYNQSQKQKMVTNALAFHPFLDELKWNLLWFFPAFKHPLGHVLHRSSVNFQTTWRGKLAYKTRSYPP